MARATHPDSENATMQLVGKLHEEDLRLSSIIKVKKEEGERVQAQLKNLQQEEERLETVIGALKGDLAEKTATNEKLRKGHGPRRGGRATTP
jgi:chromosome segregation ATPase